MHQMIQNNENFDKYEKNIDKTIAAIIAYNNEDNEDPLSQMMNNSMESGSSG